MFGLFIRLHGRTFPKRMDLPFGTPEASTFVANLGLITSDGPVGLNISTIEWTHHVSYSPGLVAVCIDPPDATHENIAATKEFGISLAADDQNVLASMAGNTKGKQTDKIALLRELGFRFVEAEHITCPLVEGACLHLECRLLQQIKPGNRTIFIGEVLKARVFPDKSPLVYHRGKFWKIGAQVPKPGREEMEKQKAVMEKYNRKT